MMFLKPYYLLPALIYKQNDINIKKGKQRHNLKIRNKPSEQRAGDNLTPIFSSRNRSFNWQIRTNALNFTVSLKREVEQRP